MKGKAEVSIRSPKMASSAPFLQKTVYLDVKKCVRKNHSSKSGLCKMLQCSFRNYLMEEECILDAFNLVGKRKIS